MLKITCPKNPRHNRFSTTAHVTQDWMVDKDGEFIGCLNECVQVDHKPEKGNIFTCMGFEGGNDCGADAIVEEVEVIETIEEI